MTDSTSDAPEQAVTRLLRRWREGDDRARDEVMPVLYRELSELARSYLRRERRDHTLETSGLVHETFLKLLDQEVGEWRNRSHFYGIAARVMRRVLVDHARRRNRDKRGGGSATVPLDADLHDRLRLADERPAEVLALDTALSRLAELDPERAALVELRFFGGLSHEEIAQSLGVSLSTVERRWRLARAFLHEEIGTR